MNHRVRAIIEEARKLTPQERLELFDLLEATFVGDEGDGTPEEVEAAWLKEVELRVANAERGEATPVDYEEAMARARQRIRSHELCASASTPRPLRSLPRQRLFSPRGRLERRRGFSRISRGRKRSCSNSRALVLRSRAICGACH